VFMHHDVSVDAKAEGATHALKGVLKDSSVRVGREQRTAVITTKGYEMALPGVVITMKAPRHVGSVACRTSPLKAKEALNGAPGFKMELSGESPTQALYWPEWEHRDLVELTPENSVKNLSPYPHNEHRVVWATLDIALCGPRTSRFVGHGPEARAARGIYGPTTLVSLLAGPMSRHTTLPVPSGAQAGVPTPLPPTLAQPVQLVPL
jgi:hypothetical protein